MWIRKSQQELMKERRARRLSTAAGVVCGASLLVVCALPHDGFRIAVGYRIAAMMTAGVMLLAWLQRARWRRSQSSVWVCERCNVVNATQDHATCACGGNMKCLSEMKWLEMPPSQQFPGTPADGEHALRVAGAI